ncbi:MAG: YidC/Oxa1 family membrane protein insertase [Microbacteriaceae bacterium]|nr:YidC/Oxa1 family membrane protein insertase [Microbacteriaceae bacterium]
MDPFTLPVLAALLAAAYSAVEELAACLEPIAPGAGAALAIVALTLLVRLALVPVGISQVKAEGTRRRLAPRLRALQLKYKKNPELLQRKTMALYKEENASPLAGILPTLAQLPVISVIYTLFIRTTVDGHANELLTETLLGVPLGASFLGSIAWPGAVVFLTLFAVIAAASWVSRVIALRLLVDAPTPATRALSWLPFLSVGFAAFVPLAAGLYLATTIVWTLAERAVLRRRYWR